jgi:hypothetical protein
MHQLLIRSLKHLSERLDRSCTDFLAAQDYTIELQMNYRTSSSSVTVESEFSDHNNSDSRLKKTDNECRREYITDSLSHTHRSKLSLHYNSLNANISLDSIQTSISHFVD